LYVPAQTPQFHEKILSLSTGDSDIWEAEGVMRLN